MPRGIATNFNWVSLPYFDFNGDGKADILWYRQSGTNPYIKVIWTMDGTSITSGGTLPAAPRATDAPSSWQSIVYPPFVALPVGLFQPGDLNGDGKTDAFFTKSPEATQQTESAAWILNGPTIASGSFLPGNPTGNPAESWFSITVDLLGSGGLGLNPEAPLPKSPIIPKYLDFNGDGKTDVFWTSGNTGQRAIWLMNGSQIAGGGFLPTAPRNDGTPFNWNPQFADFNADNKTDIFWSNFTTGEKAIWVMDGVNIASGAFLPSTPTGNNPNDWSYNFADFNGDGKTDVFWSDSVTGQKAIWLMDGTTITSGAFLANTPTGGDPQNWDYEFADFNGDGKADIFWENRVTGQKAIWTMNGTTVTGGAFLPSTPTNKDPQNWDYEFADFNGDKKTDLYWSNTVTDQKAIWLMNGLQVASGAFILNNPTNEAPSLTPSLTTV